jgi:hypothetical protein
MKPFRARRALFRFLFLWTTALLLLLVQAEKPIKTINVRYQGKLYTVRDVSTGRDLIRKLGEVEGAPDPLGMMGVFYHNGQPIEINSNASLRSKYELKNGSTIEYVGLKDAMTRQFEKMGLDIDFSEVMGLFKQENVIDVLSKVRKEQATKFILQSYGKVLQGMETFWKEVRPELEKSFDENSVLKHAKDFEKHLKEDDGANDNPGFDLVTMIVKKLHEKSKDGGLSKYKALYDAFVKAGDETLEGMHTVLNILLKGAEIHQRELELRLQALSQEDAQDPSMAMEMLDELSESEDEG